MMNDKSPLYSLVLSVTIHILIILLVGLLPSASQLGHQKITISASKNQKTYYAPLYVTPPAPTHFSKETYSTISKPTLKKAITATSSKPSKPQQASQATRKTKELEGTKQPTSKSLKQDKKKEKAKPEEVKPAQPKVEKNSSPKKNQKKPKESLPPSLPEQLKDKNATNQLPPLPDQKLSSSTSSLPINPAKESKTPAPMQPEQGSADRHALIMARIQEDLSKIWKCPPGTPPGTSAALYVKIDNLGKLKSFNISTSSGILGYDASVEKAALSYASWPYESWNQEYTLYFKNQ